MADNTQPIAVMAKLLDLSERRIQQLSREGIIPKSQRGRYELVGSVKGYIHYLRDLALKADHGIADYGTERARLIKARADLAEMEAHLKRDELIPCHQVEEAWSQILTHLRARLLVLPDKLAPTVYESDSISATKAHIKEGIWDALEEIAETTIQIDSTQGSSSTQNPGEHDTQHLDAATEPDHQSVGG